MKRNFYIIISLLIGFNHFIASSQTIKTLPLPKNSYCTGDTIDVLYETTGTFPKDNVFYVELSRFDGSFESCYYLGHGIDSSKGKFKVVLSQNTIEGTKYRIRVCGGNSHYVIVGTDNGTDMSINFFQTDHMLIKRENVDPYEFYELNETVQFSLNITSNNKGAKWDFGIGASPPDFYGVDPPQVYYRTTGYKSIIFSVDSTQTCAKFLDAASWLYACACDEKIENTSIVIDSTVSNITAGWIDTMSINRIGSPAVWIMPNAAIHSSGENHVRYYMESGGALNMYSADDCAFYLKPGSYLNVANFYHCILFISPGANINYGFPPNSDNNKISDCSNMKFYYNEAPQKGLDILVKNGFTNVNDYFQTNLLSIYPNPADDILYINTSDLEYPKKLIQIYTPEGVKIIETGFSNQVDIKSLNSGVYFIRVGNSINKFVKIE